MDGTHETRQFHEAQSSEHAQHAQIGDAKAALAVVVATKRDEVETRRGHREHIDGKPRRQVVSGDLGTVRDPSGSARLGGLGGVHEEELEDEVGYEYDAHQQAHEEERVQRVRCRWQEGHLVRDGDSSEA